MMAPLTLEDLNQMASRLSQEGRTLPQIREVLRVEIMACRATLHRTYRQALLRADNALTGPHRNHWRALADQTRQSLGHPLLRQEQGPAPRPARFSGAKASL
jgi:hypothetical protein